MKRKPARFQSFQQQDIYHFHQKTIPRYFVFQYIFSRVYAFFFIFFSFSALFGSKSVIIRLVTRKYRRKFMYQIIKSIHLQHYFRSNIFVNRLSFSRKHQVALLSYYHFAGTCHNKAISKFKEIAPKRLSKLGNRSIFILLPSVIMSRCLCKKII